VGPPIRPGLPRGSPQRRGALRPQPGQSDQGRVGPAPPHVRHVQDITERKLTQESLREAQAELAHLARVATVGELAASLAHELSQPLAAISTNASACLRWLGHDRPDLVEVTEAVRRIIRDGTGRRSDRAYARLLKKSGEAFAVRSGGCFPRDPGSRLA